MSSTVSGILQSVCLTPAWVDRELGLKWASKDAEMGEMRLVAQEGTEGVSFKLHERCSIYVESEGREMPLIELFDWFFDRDDEVDYSIEMEIGDDGVVGLVTVRVIVVETST